eukprot:5842109-Prymnesium_polylepis.1
MLEAAEVERVPSDAVSHLGRHQAQIEAQKARVQEPSIEKACNYKLGDRGEALLGDRANRLAAAASWLLCGRPGGRGGAHEGATSTRLGARRAARQAHPGARRAGERRAAHTRRDSGNAQEGAEASTQSAQ